MGFALRNVRCCIALALLLPGCRLAPEEAAFLPEDRAAVEGLAQTFAEAATEGDWGRVAALFRVDGVLFPPEQRPVEGRSDIAAALQPPPGVELISLTVDPMEIEGGSFVAFARGTFVQHFVSDTAEGPFQWSEEGSWLSVLRRDTSDPGEGWEIHRHMWNSDLPAAPPN